MDVNELLIEGEFLLLDGAMGTMLQARGLKAGEIPELVNIEHPELLREIHMEYLNAGAQVVTANTFGVNERKLQGKASAEELITSAIRIAREAIGEWQKSHPGQKKPTVALDIGPTGALLEPLGTLSFEDACSLYEEVVLCGARAGADLILIETMSDLLEMKAAILAARENSSLPVFATMTFGEDGRTFLGTSPETAAVTLNGLRVDGMGINCSLGPGKLVSLIERMAVYTDVPLIVQANAGLPRVESGRTIYDIGPDAYAEEVKRLADAGASIIGGCCGTTPEYIARIRETLADRKPQRMEGRHHTCFSSGMRMVDMSARTAVIGERINPTGKKRFKEALRKEDYAYVIEEAIRQEECGADILDVNVGLPEIDEPVVLERVVRELQGVTELPLQIDSSNPVAIERAVRCYNGKPIINSVNGKRESMDMLFPIVRKYGACVVALTLDENGIPEMAEDRAAIAGRILAEAEKYGIPASDIIVDCLVLTASTNQKEVMETLRAVTLAKKRYGVKTVLGVSNVSFGLPERGHLNTAFLAAAFGAGLDLPIINPLSDAYMDVVRSFRALTGEDRNAESYISYYGKTADRETEQTAKRQGGMDLRTIILTGRKNQSAEVTRELLEQHSPMEIINQSFIPALDEVGELFEKGTLFLPQLMASAETVKKGFQVLKEQMPQGEMPDRGTVLLATVKGDIHDIGKNIVAMLLENYGYEIVDMGRDVPPEEIVEKVGEQHIGIVGLSALMTTTVPSMEETILRLREAHLDCKVIVGGAVLNREYAEMVGADYYAKDAAETAKIVEQLTGQL